MFSSENLEEFLSHIKRDYLKKSLKKKPTDRIKLSFELDLHIIIVHQSCKFHSILIIFTKVRVRTDKQTDKQTYRHTDIQTGEKHNLYKKVFFAKVKMNKANVLIATSSLPSAEE